MSIERTDYEILLDVTAGVHDYPFLFGAINKQHIHAYDINPALDVSDPGYSNEIADATVAGPNGSENDVRNGGFVTIPTLPPIGHRILIRRITPQVQSTSFDMQREMPPRVVEHALDYQTMISQELGGRIDIVESELEEYLGEVDDIVVDDIVAALQAETEARQSADSTLQANINMEQQERQQADATLESSFNSALAGKAPTVHDHAMSDVSGLNSALNGKSENGHSHATSEITGLDSALVGKAAATHGHSLDDVSGLNAALNGKAASAHAHSLNDVAGLQAALDGKAVVTSGTEDLTAGISALPTGRVYLVYE